MYESIKLLRHLLVCLPICLKSVQKTKMSSNLQVCSTKSKNDSLWILSSLKLPAISNRQCQMQNIFLLNLNQLIVAEATILYIQFSFDVSKKILCWNDEEDTSGHVWIVEFKELKTHPLFSSRTLFRILAVH